jgi:hypothetical protein
VTDSYTGQLSVRDTVVDSFDVGVYGTVNASLVSVTGTGVPSSDYRIADHCRIDDAGHRNPRRRQLLRRRR